MVMMNAKKKKRIVLLAVVLSLLLALGIWIAWGNTALQLNAYTIASEALPKSFDGYRIAHVSDLHNAQMGKNNEKLLSTLREAEPDIIAITGDLIDSRRTDTTIALRFAEEAVKIAPCFYVTGNHEARLDDYDAFKNELTERGVVVLENECLVLERAAETITLLGVDDPSFETDYLHGDANAVMQDQLSALTSDDAAFRILLSHRPELFDSYADHNVDLVLSGHAHGGQFRIPFVGGVIAPNQGLFPKYDGGRYAGDGTVMIVSRGIGNSLFPFRINNRPEVILVELKAK